MQTITHPHSGATIEGIRLSPGSKIREDDWYNSSDGKWRAAGLIADCQVPKGDHVIWVRQTTLSDDARTLLGYLNLKVYGKQTCIGERNGNYYVIPSPTFNWDGRFDIEAKCVRYPDSVQELADHGYLTRGEHDIRRSESDYAVCELYGTNYAYTLTAEGTQKGKEILAN